MKFRHEKGKICACCHKELPLSAFYEINPFPYELGKKPSYDINSNGLDNFCSECHKKKARELLIKTKKKEAEELRKEAEELMRTKYSAVLKYKERLKEQLKAS